jgi:hypothetical protein
MWETPTSEGENTMSVQMTETESVIGFPALESNYAVLINNAIGEHRNADVNYIVRSYNMEKNNITRKSVIERLRDAF